MLLRSGTALIGMGEGEGENAVEQAIQSAVSCPLLEDFSNCKARGIIVNVTMNEELGLEQYTKLGSLLQRSFATEDSDTKFGCVINPNMKPDAVHVTIVLAGLTEVDKPASENINTILSQSLLNGDGSDENAGVASMFMNTPLNQKNDSQGDMFADVSNVVKNDTSDSSCELPAWLTKKSN